MIKCCEELRILDLWRIIVNNIVCKQSMFPLAAMKLLSNPAHAKTVKFNEIDRPV